MAFHMRHKRDASCGIVFRLRFFVFGPWFSIPSTPYSAGYRITDFRLFSQLATSTPHLVFCRVDAGLQPSTACGNRYCMIDRESASLV